MLNEMGYRWFQSVYEEGKAAEQNSSKQPILENIQKAKSTKKGLSLHTITHCLNITNHRRQLHILAVMVEYEQTKIFEFETQDPI